EVLEAYSPTFAWARIDAVAVQPESVSTYGPTLLTNPATARAKASITSDLKKSHNVIAAFGDSEADLPMLRAARFKVVVDNPTLMEPADDVLHLQSSSDPDRAVAAVRELLTRTTVLGEDAK